MNKIIPFNKEITFNDKIGEITSIALDDTLKFEDDYTIKGDLIVRGCHKVNDVEEDFSYTIPALISVDEKYDTSMSTVSIDDFYYEIINDEILKVKIDLILDNLAYKEEKPEELRETVEYVETKDKGLNINADFNKTPETLDIGFDLEKKDLENTEMNAKSKEEKVDVTDLFKATNNDPEYSVYRVYVVEDNDTLDVILDKYKITREELEKYNDLSNIKRGDKLIIPSVDE